MTSPPDVTARFLDLRLPALRIHGLLLLGLLLSNSVFASDHRLRPANPDSAPPLAPVTKEGQAWSRATLEGFSLEEKAAQMVFVRVFGQYAHAQAEEVQELESVVRDLSVGGLVLFDSDLETIPRRLNQLQTLASVPLLVAADLERGLGFRVRRGTVDLPYAMAVGATRSEEAARFTGRVTARESRAVGIHWAFAPVVDVQDNPANPVIHLRSYGEDPDLVARLSSAFLLGAQKGGLLTTAKHFPGHGNTELDSHHALPTLEVDRQHLEAVELLPFRHGIKAGVDSIMLGHLAVPALDPSGAPASLSPAMGQTLLRDEMGFRGLVVTDALEMAGAQRKWSGANVVDAVLAGADVVLMPRDAAVAIQSLTRAVREGLLSEERLDESVQRILLSKARLGLHEERLVDARELDQFVARPQDQARAAAITAASITVVRNERGLLPLAAEKPMSLLHLTAARSPNHGARQGAVARALRQRRLVVESRSLWGDIGDETSGALLKAAESSTHILVSAFPGPGRLGLPQSQLDLLRRLQETDTPMILTSFGSPYLLQLLPELPVYLCAYGTSEAAQRAAVKGILGEIDIQGKLPVSLPGLYPFGHGLELPRREMTLVKAEISNKTPLGSSQEDRSKRDMAQQDTASGVGSSADSLAAASLPAVDRLMEGFLDQKAFPGAVVAVGHKGQLIHLRGYGHQTYEPLGETPDSSPIPVSEETIYDLASLTKVIVPTTLAMMLVDQGQLDLEMPVQDFLPLFRGESKTQENGKDRVEDSAKSGAKARVTIHQLLTHSSGIDWWAPLFQEVKGKAAYVERIQAMELAYEPGSRSLYSDLGLILFGEIIERIAGKPLDVLAREWIFQPLGMEETSYLPSADWLNRIAPTEVDSWRGRLLRGEVHDENAFALGGVAPHAGLFGTAHDLSRFAQMVLNGGVFEHHRLVARSTMEVFTQRQAVPDSTRGLGWDTKSAEKSSAGKRFSPDSFGHTGFTGTSLWIDPQRELFLILLTNRVHPTRENILIRQVRPALADAVIEALEGPL